MPAHLYTSAPAQTVTSGVITRPIIDAAQDAQRHCAEEWGEWTAIWERELPTVLDDHEPLYLRVTADDLQLYRQTQTGRCPEFMDVDVETLPERDAPLFAGTLSRYPADDLAAAVAPEDEAALRKWQKQNADDIFDG